MRRWYQSRQRRLLLVLSGGALMLSATAVAAGSRLTEPRRAPRPRIAGEQTDPRANVTSFISLVDSLGSAVDELGNLPSLLPTLGRVSSVYTRARRHPILHDMRPHYGIDIAAPAGTPVVAPAAGMVIMTTSGPGYGLMLEVEHDRGLVTLYGHLSRVHVHEGQVVSRGERIAEVGSTGISTGPHLHYEVHVRGKPVDPLTFGP